MITHIESTQLSLGCNQVVTTWWQHRQPEVVTALLHDICDQICEYPTFWMMFYFEYEHIQV